MFYWVVGGGGVVKMSPGGCPPNCECWNEFAGPRLFFNFVITAAFPKNSVGEAAEHEVNGDEAPTVALTGGR